jgi:RNA polymerase sigma-70 factor (ECF subfamily)
MEESILISEAKKGDISAFNRLVMIYQEQVFNVAYRLLHDEMAAQDVTQDTFIKSFQKIRTFRGGSFRAWLLRIATNACYDALRRKKRHPNQPLTLVDSESGDDIDYLADNRDQSSPEDHAVTKELENAIQKCIEKLPMHFRTVLILVDVQGLGYHEASKIARSPIGTIRSRLARARMRVKDCLLGFRELLPAQYGLKYRRDV